MSELDDPTVVRFLETFPGAYAQVCQEPSGELCLYTDIEYSTYTMASGISITLFLNDIATNIEHVTVIHSVIICPTQSGR